jgi:hypothetical protein
MGSAAGYVKRGPETAVARHGSAGPAAGEGGNGRRNRPVPPVPDRRTDQVPTTHRSPSDGPWFDYDYDNRSARRAPR